ncbi:MAG: hypothetical protein KDC93_08285 [Cyclobacteriaceae bacterium]|nr:hypothetical protein [Cyclobacteriaceae bacterium]
MKKLLIIMFFSVPTVLVEAQNAGTREDREALFNYIYEKTLDREAFSDLKEQHYGIDVREEMLKVKDEVVNASTDLELYYALVKLSAARRDSHLDVSPIEGGLVLPEIQRGTVPIRFHPDYTDKNNVFFFVADLAKDRSVYDGKAPSIGDELIQVNGEPADYYINRASEYISCSTRENFLRRMAFGLSEKNRDLPPSFYKENLTLTLKPKKGKEYTITLPYLNDVVWQYGRMMKDYVGYELVSEIKRESFEVYKPTDPNNKTILLWWYGFRGDLQDASDELVDWAEKNNMLDYDLIIDAIDSRGGSQGAYALARLTSKPFKTTGGNIKLSDITDDFIAGYTRRYVARQAAMDGDGRESEDDGTWVMDWLHGPVLKGIAAGQEYSNNVPFKCAHLPHYSDWVMQPAEKHFTGNMVIMLGPWGGSHLSQFAAMIIDNNLGHSIGMPDGGYSNTWEWEEDLIFPISKKPVVEFMWNIGHTISPSGQIVEGNPSQVAEYIPVSRDNYLNYKPMLVNKAQEWLRNEKALTAVKINEKR